MSLIPALNAPTTGNARIPAPLVANDNAIRTVVNGSLDYENLSDAGVTAVKLADAAKLGLDDGTSTRRGKSIIATEESTTSASYTALTTPDQVSSIVLPSDGLIFVAFQGLWKTNSTQSKQASIFLGANQLKRVNWAGGNPYAYGSEAVSSAVTADNYVALASFSGGLRSSVNATIPIADTTTGQVVGVWDSNAGSDWQGGICAIFAAAGTYDISVKYLVASGTLTVKNRSLWVWTMGF